MKKILFISALCCVIIANGCEKKKAVQKESTSVTQFPKKKSGDESSFTKGIDTKFNSANKIESAAKKKATKFGRITKKPKVLTPDLVSLNEAMVVEGFPETVAGVFTNGTSDVPSYAFDYENDISALNRLYKKHKFENLIVKKMTDFDIASELVIYVYNYLKDGREPTIEEFWEITGPSAETIAKLKEEQNIGGTSEHYAAFMAQLALTCGFTSRLISMHTIDDSGQLATHDVCELYMPTLKKWVVFDPYMKATYYMRDKLPLSAFEIRDLMLRNLVKDITPVIMAGDFTDVVAVREKLVPRYQYLYIWRMNDFISKSPRGKSMSWQQLYSSHLVWEDVFSLTKDGQFDKLEKFSNIDDKNFPLKGVQYVAHEIYDFNWSINETQVDVERTGAENLRLYLDTMTPNFDFFWISAESPEGKEISKVKNGVVDLIFLVGDINIATVNKLGVMGPATTISILMK